MILHFLTTIAAEVATVLPVQIPNPAPVAPPGADKFIQVMAWAKWVALAIAVIGLIGAGAMMTINSRRGEGSEHAGKIGAVLAGVIVIGAAGAIVGFIAA